MAGLINIKNGPNQILATERSGALILNQPLLIPPFIDLYLF